MRRAATVVREVIKADKYWSLGPDYKDACYVLALTRADHPTEGGFLARATRHGQVLVPDALRRWCRRGMVLLVVDAHPRPTVRSVIPWDVFSRLMRIDTRVVLNELGKGRFPQFAGSACLRRLLSSSADPAPEVGESAGRSDQKEGRRRQATPARIPRSGDRP